MSYSPRNLDGLEAEAIHVIREVAAKFENPVLPYSIGKDSMCMLHVARKAFAAGPAHRQGRGRLDGTEKARRVFL